MRNIHIDVADINAVLLIYLQKTEEAFYVQDFKGTLEGVHNALH